MQASRSNGSGASSSRAGGAPGEGSSTLEVDCRHNPGTAGVIRDHLKAGRAVRIRNFDLAAPSWSDLFDISSSAEPLHFEPPGTSNGASAAVHAASANRSFQGRVAAAKALLNSEGMEDADACLLMAQCLPGQVPFVIEHSTEDAAPQSTTAAAAAAAGGASSSSAPAKGAAAAAGPVSGQRGMRGAELAAKLAVQNDAMVAKNAAILRCIADDAVEAARDAAEQGEAGEQLALLMEDGPGGSGHQEGNGAAAQPAVQSVCELGPYSRAAVRAVLASARFAERSKAGTAELEKHWALLQRLDPHDHAGSCLLRLHAAWASAWGPAVTAPDCLQARQQLLPVIQGMMGDQQHWVQALMVMHYSLYFAAFVAEGVEGCGPEGYVVTSALAAIKDVDPHAWVPRLLSGLDMADPVLQPSVLLGTKQEAMAACHFLGRHWMAACGGRTVDHRIIVWAPALARLLAERSLQAPMLGGVEELLRTATVTWNIQRCFFERYSWHTVSTEVESALTTRPRSAAFGKAATDSHIRGAWALALMLAQLAHATHNKPALRHYHYWEFAEGAWELCKELGKEWERHVPEVLLQLLIKRAPKMHAQALRLLKLAQDAIKPNDTRWQQVEVLGKMLSQLCLCVQRCLWAGGQARQAFDGVRSLLSSCPTEHALPLQSLQAYLRQQVKEQERWNLPDSLLLGPDDDMMELLECMNRVLGGEPDTQGDGSSNCPGASRISDDGPAAAANAAATGAAATGAAATGAAATGAAATGAAATGDAATGAAATAAANAAGGDAAVNAGDAGASSSSSMGDSSAGAQVGDGARRASKKQCAQCRRVLGKKRVCGGCGEVRYCSQECQRLHWKDGHRHECSRALLQAGPTATAAAATGSRAAHHN